MEIDLFYFEDCPAWQETLANLEAALKAEGLLADIHPQRVEDDAAAARFKFLGSPSLRVDGVDLWPEERRRYTLNCRVYPTPHGLRGAPTVEMLREQLRAKVAGG
jgi:hypothetical protein